MCTFIVKTAIWFIGGPCAHSFLFCFVFIAFRQTNAFRVKHVFKTFHVVIRVSELFNHELAIKVRKKSHAGFKVFALWQVFCIVLHKVCLPKRLQSLKFQLNDWLYTYLKNIKCWLRVIVPGRINMLLWDNWNTVWLNITRFFFLFQSAK